MTNTIQIKHVPICWAAAKTVEQNNRRDEFTRCTLAGKRFVLQRRRTTERERRPPSSTPRVTPSSASTGINMKYSLLVTWLASQRANTGLKPRWEMNQRHGVIYSMCLKHIWPVIFVRSHCVFHALCLSVISTAGNIGAELSYNNVGMFVSSDAGNTWRAVSLTPTFTPTASRSAAVSNFDGWCKELNTFTNILDSCYATPLVSTAAHCRLQQTSL